MRWFRLLIRSGHISRRLVDCFYSGIVRLYSHFTFFTLPGYLYCTRELRLVSWCLAFTCFFYLGIAVFAPRARCTFTFSIVLFLMLLWYLYSAREFRLLRRVTLLQQPKRVTRKGRRYAGRPVKSTGFPLLCCRHHAVKKLAHVERHARSDSFHRKLMIPSTQQWLG